jgi:cardiolipin synthase
MKFPLLTRSQKKLAPIAKAVRSYPRLEMVAVFIGFLALFFILVLFLVPLPKRPPLSVTTPLVAGSPQFLGALSGLLSAPVQKGEPIEILNNGDEFEPALIASIREAKASINITDYIWNKGQFSGSLFDALTAAAARGVQVRVLTDAGETKFDKEKLAAFEKAGGRFELFRTPSVSTITRLNKRTHRRAMIIDGREGYLGGVAIDDAWLGDGRTPGHWRDMMFKVKGGMAGSLESAFATEWYETTGEVIAGDAFYPLIAAAGPLSYINIVAAPTEYSKPIEDLYLLSIRSAHISITIENPYFLPSGEMLEALIDAAHSGVKVRVMLPASAFSPVHRAAEINYSKMLDAGFEVYEYKTLLHTKTMSVDGMWSVIGSANIDNRSRSINNENDFGVADPALAKALESTFAADTAFATQVTKEEWEKHRILDTLLAYLSLPLVKQY